MDGCSTYTMTISQDGQLETMETRYGEKMANGNEHQQTAGVCLNNILCE